MTFFTSSSRFLLVIVWIVTSFFLGYTVRGCQNVQTQYGFLQTQFQSNEAKSRIAAYYQVKNAYEGVIQCQKQRDMLASLQADAIQQSQARFQCEKSQISLQSAIACGPYGIETKQKESGLFYAVRKM